MATRKAHEVDSFLRRPDPAFTVFLIYGPNGGLVNERARALARRFVENPEDAFQLVRLEGDDIASDPSRIADEANTIGLFGGRRSIWVRAGSRNIAPLIQPLLAVPPQDARVVVEAGDLAARNPLRTAVEGARTAMALPCYADEGRDLPGIIDGVLAEWGLTADRDAKELLRQSLSPDRLLIRRELEKLACYADGAAAVSLRDVEAVVADAGVSVLDTVLDAIFLGDMHELDRGLSRLAQEGEDAGVLVGAALRHAMMLHKARINLDAGMDMDRVTDVSRIFFKRKQAFQRQLAKWPRLTLESAIATLREAQAQARRNGGLAMSLASRAFITVAMRASRS
ncbi:DNA polymerase III subunit delta [Alsobacter metallidurans]|uniref:DNA-directed DNA polymerase n=1 Tax=Alsobacter metallidurans TaxID=340221 RepID=A0A917IBI2_9HYPH|nr:DNA polymerase III subunit delta [Alsobacter metallidurans]GGH33608.1 DNA polymerase III subunit delta [Alsobacter metallidurans]